MIGPQTRITQYMQKHGSMPSAHWLAVTSKISTEEAEGILHDKPITQKKTSVNEKPIAQKSSSNVPENTPATRLGESKSLHIFDRPALAIAVIVDLMLVGISLFVIAPGPIEKVGMSMLSIVVVLFAVRGWVIGGKLGKALWICFAAACFFIDLSFALVATDLQGEKVVDTELVRLTEKVDKAELEVSDLQRQFDEANNRSTLDQLNEQKKAAESKAETYRIERQNRLSRFESGGTKEITSTALSTAIFDAATSGKPGRVTFLVLFGLIFAGLQLTMITAATSSFRRKE